MGILVINELKDVKNFIQGNMSVIIHTAYIDHSWLTFISHFRFQTLQVVYQTCPRKT